MSVDEANGRRVIVSRLTFALADLMAELRFAAPNMSTAPRLVLDEAAYRAVVAEIANHAGIPTPDAPRSLVAGVILETSG